MEKLIPRPEYIKKLKSFRDKDLIKIVTGIRRCGKSTLFDLFINDLIQSGVPESHILHLKFTSAETDNIKDAKGLYDEVISKIKIVDNNKYYIFLDEIQEIEGWEKACNYLYEDKRIDLYLTGSNSHMLSSDLATYISGRYVEIKMMPLSFKEYCSVKPDKSPFDNYQDYVTNGSFPYSVQFNDSQDIITYLEGIYSSVVIKDVAKRNKISDIASLENVTRFIFDNIGNPLSATKISNTLKSHKQSVSVPTIENYLKALCSAFILYRAERYDIKGKEYLTGGYKYYVSDLGLRRTVLGNKPVDFGHVLENVVYLELIRRGYEVYVGKTRGAEVDFIAKDQNENMTYFQVAYMLDSEETLKRELAPLQEINDHNQKYLLSLDFAPEASYDGIKRINVLDWLLEK